MSSFPPQDRLPPERAGLLERQRTARTSPVPTGIVVNPLPRRPVPRFHVLTIATGWRSAFGGLNTLNREFSCALAAVGCRVVCAVPHAIPAERTHARSKSVELVVPDSGDGTVSRADLPHGFTPELVVGHGRITGHAAMSVVEAFPSARRLHFVHVAPDEIDPFKIDTIGGAGTAERAVLTEARTRKELEIGQEAYRIVAVGPRLQGRYLTDFHPMVSAPVLRFDPGFDTFMPEPEGPPIGTSWRVLLFGRAEDANLKGLDIAARAVALAARRRGRRAVTVEFWVRGAPEGTTSILEDKLRAWAGDDSLCIVVRSYTTDPSELQNDLRRASLVLMPSRAEGFGLAGLEAIIGGVPVLVSRNSGLGDTLMELLDEEERLRTVLEVEGDPSKVAETWARAIEKALDDRPAAFRRAKELRDRLAGKRTWTGAAHSLLRDLMVVDTVSRTC